MVGSDVVFESMLWWRKTEEGFWNHRVKKSNFKVVLNITVLRNKSIMFMNDTRSK